MISMEIPAKYRHGKVRENHVCLRGN